MQCQATGRCGECGNDWPCDDHKMNHSKLGQLNFDNGAAARAYANLAIHRASRLDWCEEALEAVYTIASQNEEFTTDDVWTLVGPPPQPRNMGNVMRKAQREGYCSTTDRTTPSADKRRGDKLMIWKSEIWE